MVRGLYIASTGMNVQTKRMDVISNDLANANTVGYKKDTAVVSSFPQLLMKRLDDMENHIPNNNNVGAITAGARVSGVYTNFMQGSFVQTNGTVDVALQGDGFFVVNTPAGLAYTRDGSFAINSQGQIVTKEGYAVMGQNGALALGEDYLQNGGEVAITQDGELRLNGTLIDNFDIATFTDNQALTKMADNLYQGGGQRAAFAGTVIQGYTEASNVNPVTAMVDMITVSRAYEANQKMVQIHDSLIGKAVNEVGRV